jgi:hypothetical protein
MQTTSVCANHRSIYLQSACGPDVAEGVDRGALTPACNALRGHPEVSHQSVHHLHQDNGVGSS